jgi:flagellar biosynthesis component FlhA
MYKESKKVLAVGLVLSAVCWWLILTAVSLGALTAVYSLPIIGAFFGAMMVLVGITNSMSQSIEEYEAEQPWAMKYKMKKSYYQQSQYADQLHHARQADIYQGYEHA